MPVKTYGLVILSSLILFALVGCQPQASSQALNLRQFDPPMAISDFELTDMHGEPFQLSDAQGNIVLIYFGYTFCPDVCPMTMYDVAQALDGFEQRDKVQVVFISVDPERDTPQMVARYVTAFDPHFIGLTDDWDKIQTVMRDYGAFAEIEAVENSAAGYLVNHTARVYLLSPDQQLMGTYAFGFEPEELRSDLEKLVNVWY